MENISLFIAGRAIIEIKYCHYAVIIFLPCLSVFAPLPCEYFKCCTKDFQCYQLEYFDVEGEWLDIVMLLYGRKYTNISDIEHLENSIKIIS